MCRGGPVTGVLSVRSYQTGSGKAEAGVKCLQPFIHMATRAPTFPTFPTSPNSPTCYLPDLPLPGPLRDFAAG